MSRRMWVLAVTGWIGVVIAGSALTWIAISRAGDQVTGGSDPSTTQPVVVSTLGNAPTASPTPPHVPRSTPTGTVAPPTTTTGAPTSAAPTHTAKTRPASPTPKPPSASSAPAPRTETRTWTGTAGFVTVSCSGGQAQLKGASPSEGWSYEVGKASGDSVEVQFQKGESQVEVHAECVGGTPRIDAESDND